MSTRPPSEQLRDWIVELGLVPNASCFYSWEPTEPDECVTVYDTPGTGMETVADLERPVLEQCGLQVRVRSTTYGRAYVLLQQIAYRITSKDDKTLLRCPFDAVLWSGSAVSLGQDDNRRSTLTRTFRVFRNVRKEGERQ